MPAPFPTHVSLFITGVKIGEESITLDRVGAPESCPTLKRSRVCATHSTILSPRHLAVSFADLLNVSRDTDEISRRMSQSSGYC